MLDKKIINNLDILIKKIKDNNLESIKISNKTNSIEITNNSSQLNQYQEKHINKMQLNDDIISTDVSKNIITIDSPMVGIIYITPKPSSPPFVKLGQKIKKGDTVCLIEAMKTFNEIKSDKDGIVKTILIKNGEAVEFGQPLFEIS